MKRTFYHHTLTLCHVIKSTCTTPQRTGKMEAKLVLVFVTYLAVVNANVFAEDKEDLEAVINVLSKTRKLDRYKTQDNEVS